MFYLTPSGPFPLSEFRCEDLTNYKYQPKNFNLFP